MPPASATSRRRRRQPRPKSIEEADGFAQVFPEHKFHIVDVLQKQGHIVGMTGDGVNDAPALKKADCGIAVSDATDAARAAASIVLMSSGPVGDHRRHQGEPQDRPADEQLRHLPHRRDAAGAVVRHSGDPDLQLLPGDGDHDRGAGAAQRRLDPVHRLRQRALQAAARGLEHAPGARDGHRAGPRRPHRRLRPVLPGRPGVPPRPAASPDAHVPDAVGGRLADDLTSPAPVARSGPSARRGSWSWPCSARRPWRRCSRCSGS